MRIYNFCFERPIFEEIIDDVEHGARVYDLG